MKPIHQIPNTADRKKTDAVIAKKKRANSQMAKVPPVTLNWGTPK